MSGTSAILTGPMLLLFFASMLLTRSMDLSLLPASKRAAVQKFQAREGGPCEFKRVNGSSMNFDTFLQVLKTNAGEPIVFESVDGLEALMRGTGEEEVMAKHGDNRVSMEGGVDESRTNFHLKIEAVRPFKDYINKPTGGQELVFELGNFGNFSRGLWKARTKEIPEMLRQMTANPMVTLGNMGSGTNMHRHRESWLLQLKGRKAWWIGHPSTTRNSYYGSYSPCSHMGRENPPDIKFCVQQPGQLVYFHPKQWHATCNIDDWTWGIGGQGRTTEWPDVIVNAGWGNLDAVTSAVATHMDSGSMTRSLYAAIMHRALIFSHSDISDDLLKHASKVAALPLGEEIDEHFTQSPVHAAIIAGDVVLAKKLLKAGFDAEDPWTDKVPMLPLEMAARLGHSALVDLFASKDGPRWAEDKETLLPIILNGAAVDGHLDVVKKLKQLGGELDKGGNLGQQPVHVAAGGGQLDVVKYLVGKHKKLIHSIDDDGNTPAHVAAEQGHKTVIEFLLSKKAKIHANNKKGMQPLHLAAEQSQYQVVEHLLKTKAKVHDDNRGATPMHFAAGMGAYEVVELLLERRADTRRTAPGNVQPLHIAALMSGGRFIVELLARNRAQLDARTVKGETPLMMARQRGNLPTAEAIERLMDEEEEDNGDEDEKDLDDEESDRDQETETDL